jgi:hypothetical protein
MEPIADSGHTTPDRNPAMIDFHTPAIHPAAYPLKCALDRHLGPYLPLPALAGVTGAEWCRCRACGSLLTRASSQRNAA